MDFVDTPVYHTTPPREIICEYTFLTTPVPHLPVPCTKTPNHIFHKMWYGPLLNRSVLFPYSSYLPPPYVINFRQFSDSDIPLPYKQHIHLVQDLFCCENHFQLLPILQQSFHHPDISTNHTLSLYSNTHSCIPYMLLSVCPIYNETILLPNLLSLVFPSV